MPALKAMNDDWTPAKLREHQAWRARMYAPTTPRPDPLAARLDVMADLERAALERKVSELELKLATMREELETARARGALSKEPLDVQPRIGIEEIIRTVCRYYGVSVTEIKSARRTTALANVRHVAVYLCKELTLQSYPEIGRHFGGRDHSTAVNSVQRVTEMRLKDPVLCQEVAELEGLFA